MRINKKIMVLLSTYTITLALGTCFLNAMNQDPDTDSTLEGLKRLVEISTAYTQDLISELNALEFTEEMYGCALNTIEREICYVIGKKYPHPGRDALNFPESLDLKMYEIGNLKQEFSLLTEPWFANRGMLSILELKRWRSAVIIRSKAIIAMLLTIAHSFYPDHFEIPEDGPLDEPNQKGILTFEHLKKWPEAITALADQGFPMSPRLERHLH